MLLTGKRVCSFWIALDDINKENGCMMCLRSSHQSKVLRKHEFAYSNGVLKSSISEDEEVY
jgi:ectoine hydroxylase-related dioxygenase (phytanoyl-CoA dioxygenase family)